MEAVPADIPVTVPLPSIVATAGVPLLQVPPVTALVSISEEPAHTTGAEGLMAEGVVSTVTVLVAAQPLTV
jgi:hypothetical protein